VTLPKPGDLVRVRDGVSWRGEMHWSVWRVTEVDERMMRVHVRFHSGMMYGTPVSLCKRSRNGSYAIGDDRMEIHDG